MSNTDTNRILDVIEAFFEVGRTKDTATLYNLQLDDARFSSFSDVPPLDMKDFKTTLMLEELRFVSISDYNYKMINPKVSIFGDSAVVALELQQTGMLVDNKNYTGEHISVDGRATFVLVRINREWKIVHIHLSRS
jgi:ketosteroid isomerase-like protein